MAKLIDQEIRIATLVRCPSAETVYQGFASAAGMDGWFTQGAEVDARPGGKILFRWRDWGPDHYDGEELGKVIEANPGKAFVFEWKPGKVDFCTRVSMDFESVPEGTVIRLREWGYHDTPQGLAAMLDCAAGWGEALALWKFHIEHGLRY